MNVATPRQASALVLVNERLTPEVHRLLLRLDGEWGPAHPGQFVELECPPPELFGLRRPFSLAGCRRRAGDTELEIVYGAVGERTRALSRCRAGEALSVVGPLGRPFAPVPGRRPVLIGGGRGVAPMLMLADSWKEEFPDGLLLYGARTAPLLIPLGEVPYPLHLATDDGSQGTRGSVVDLLQYLQAREAIRPVAHALYACGPNRMLAALSRWAAEAGYPCQVSLETHFGCGVGICAGCAVPVKADASDPQGAFGRYIFACQEGPVVDGTRIEWEGLAE